MLYPKTILTTHTGDVLVRYAKESYRSLFKIIKSEDKNGVYDQILQLAEEVEDYMPDLYYFIQDFNGHFYAAVLIEVDNTGNIPVLSFKNSLRKTTKRILQWYIYAYLVPLAQKREPFKNYNDADDNE